MQSKGRKDRCTLDRRILFVSCRFSSSPFCRASCAYPEACARSMRNSRLDNSNGRWKNYFQLVYCCQYFSCCLPCKSVEGETSVIMSHHLEWREPRWSLLVIFFAFLLRCAVVRCAALCCAVLRWAALGWAHLISPWLAANRILMVSVLNFNQINEIRTEFQSNASSSSSSRQVKFHCVPVGSTPHNIFLSELGNCRQTLIQYCMYCTGGFEGN